MNTETLQETSRRLTARADRIVKARDLMSILLQQGQPELIGRASFGLMGKPDIEIGTPCEGLDPAAILEAFLPLVGVAGVKVAAST